MNPCRRQLAFSDYVANLYLVDESIAGRDRLELMLFSKFSSHLPGVKESGDIIRLRDVRVRDGGGGQAFWEVKDIVFISMGRP